MRYDHVAFEVADLDAAIRFYVDRLGFEETWRHRNEQEAEECAFLSAGDVRLELLAVLGESQGERPPPAPPYCPHLAIAVDDLIHAAAALKEQGIAILRGPLEVTNKVRWLYFADPDGNVVEYVEWLSRKTIADR